MAARGTDVLRAFLLDRLATLGSGAVVIFALGAAVFALWSNRAWLLIIVVLTVLFAWGLDMWRREKEVRSIRELAESEAKKRELLEKKISELPLETLSRITHAVQQTLWFYTHGRLVKVISFLERMKALAQAGSEFEVRQVHEMGGSLYFAVRMEEGAAEKLRFGDPFLLMARSGMGVKEPVALLLFHQMPKPFKNAVFFRLVQSYRREIVDSLRVLATTRDIQGPKGYSVETIADLDRYGEMDNRLAYTMLSALAADLEGQFVSEVQSGNESGEGHF